MKYAKSSKGYYVPKGAKSTDQGQPTGQQASQTPDTDPLEQFASTGQGKTSSFGQAGFKRAGSYGDKDLFAPTSFGQGASQVVNVDGQDYTIGFLKNKQGDSYSAVLVDRSGNVRAGSTKDQAINDMLSNFQNLNGSQMSRALYDFGITQTTSPTQRFNQMAPVEGTRQGSVM